MLFLHAAFLLGCGGGGGGGIGKAIFIMAHGCLGRGKRVLWVGPQDSPAARNFGAKSDQTRGGKGGLPKQKSGKYSIYF